MKEQPSWLSQSTQGRFREEEQKHTKRGAKIEPGVSLLFASFGSACPHVSRMYFPLLANKTELYDWSVLSSNFCCSEREQRKLHTLLTIVNLYT